MLMDSKSEGSEIVMTTIRRTVRPFFVTKEGALDDAKFLGVADFEPHISSFGKWPYRDTKCRVS